MICPVEIGRVAHFFTPSRIGYHPYLCFGEVAACIQHFADTVSKLESPMNTVQIEQKSYEMPPREGISIAQFLTVADIERSAHYYEKVLGAPSLSLGDGNAPAERL